MQSTEEELHAMMMAALDGGQVPQRRLLMAIALELRSYFERRLRGRETEAEDLVQETLIAVHTRRATFDRTRLFTPWLFAIARYKLIDWVRRQHAHVPLETLEHVLAGDDFELGLAAKIDVAELLATLPAKQSMAIRRTKIEGASIDDVARSDGLSVSDVKISVHRGLRALAARVRGQ